MGFPIPSEFSYNPHTKRGGAGRHSQEEYIVVSNSCYNAKYVGGGLILNSQLSPTAIQKVCSWC